MLVEIKSARTPSGQYFNAFERFAASLGKDRRRHASPAGSSSTAGDESQKRSRGELLSWRDLDTFEWAAGGG